MAIACRMTFVTYLQPVTFESISGQAWLFTCTQVILAASMQCYNSFTPWPLSAAERAPRRAVGAT